VVRACRCREPPGCLAHPSHIYRQTAKSTILRHDVRNGTFHWDNDCALHRQIPLDQIRAAFSMSSVNGIVVLENKGK